MLASQDDDTILVGPGTYHEQVQFFGPEVTLASTAGPDTTIIDASGHDVAVVIQRGQTSATTIDGFTITTRSTGRGILLKGTSPKILNNIIRDNYALSGAGIFCESSSPTIKGNRFSRNVGVGRISPIGGAVSLALGSNPTIESNTFHENTSALNGGGAIGVTDSSALIAGNHFENNTGLFGSAIGALTQASYPIVIRDNTFRDDTINLSVLGTLTLERNRFDDSPLFVAGSANAQLVNNSLRGGHLRASQASCRLIHNTLFDARLILDSAEMIAVNTILWGQTEQPVSENGSGTLTAEYCNIRGGWPGEGNIDVDPRVVAAADGDLRLRIDSPCIDVGTLDHAELPPDDIEGQTRPLPGRRFGDALADIGADEMSIAHAVRFGTVGAASATFDSLDDVVLVNGTAGDLQREVHASATTEIRLDMVAPEAGPATAPFALYGYAGAPTHTSPIRQPGGLGWMSFGTLLRSNQSPPFRVIWNNLGPFPRLGFPGKPSQPAPSRVFRARPGTFQPGDVITFQGFILDQQSESPFGASVTNAVVLRVMP